MTIHALVVDDDPVTRGLVAEQLISLQADSVRTVDSGRAALEMLSQHHQINLLVTDLRMPDLDGIALIAALDQFRNRLRVIIISALGDKLMQAASRIGVGYELSILGVIRKPVGRRALAAMLDKFRELPAESDAVELEDIPAIRPEDILQALNENGHHIVVQPEVRAARMSLEAVEVLSRWSHPKLQGHSPADVIVAAEQAGIINALNQNLIDEAGRAWRSWAQHKLSPRISINLSAITMADTTFPEWLTKAIGEHQMSPRDLILEVTETAVPAAGTSNLEVACRLGLFGYELSVDDFGTGFANLKQLQDMPFRWLKIDRAFVNQIERSEDARSIIKSSISMAHDLGLETVGEGVETAEQCRMLRDFGCDLLQGYFIGRPMPPSELPQWYEKFRKERATLAA